MYSKIAWYLTLVSQIFNFIISGTGVMVLKSFPGNIIGLLPVLGFNLIAIGIAYFAFYREVLFFAWLAIIGLIAWGILGSLTFFQAISNQSLQTLPASAAYVGIASNACIMSLFGYFYVKALIALEKREKAKELDV